MEASKFRRSAQVRLFIELGLFVKSTTVVKSAGLIFGTIEAPCRIGVLGG
jgi:hypothetical protein